VKITVNGLIREVAPGTSVDTLVASVHRGVGPPGTYGPPSQPAGQRRAGRTARARPPARPATGRPGVGVVVAVNDEVVPRSAWARTVLADNDRVEVLTAATEP
jgi:sulfur carrier protein ThiS